MSRIIDLRESGGELVVLGRALVLPSDVSGSAVPLDGSIRFNTTAGTVQMCISGVWSDIGSGDGGGLSAPFAISDTTGLQAALDGKANAIHVHALTDVTGLQTALSGKSDINHGHAISTIPNLQPTLDSLQSQVNGKAPISHTHVIANVTGLQTALDNKAAYTHSHVIGDVTGLQAALTALQAEKIGVCLPGQAPSGFSFSWTATQAVTFAANFFGSIGAVQTQATADYTIAVSLRGSQIGTVRALANNSVVAFATTGANVVNIAVGDTLVFTCPTADATISNMSFTLLGTRT